MAKRKGDFLIRNEGTIVMFTPLTESARRFLREKVESESWQWMGESLCVDHRPAQELLHALIHVELFECISE